MGLVAWYRFDDGDARDYSGNDNHGEAHGATPADGKIGQAMEFDGNDYVSFQNPLIEGQSFSIAFWAKTFATSNQCFACTRTVVGNGLSIFILDGNYLRFDTGSQWSTGYLMPTDKWVHIAATRDDHRKALYVNGKLFSSTASVGTMATLSDVFMLGASHSNGSSLGNYLRGNIDDMRIYDHALSEKEVKELSKAKVLHYKFDDFQEPTENLIKTPDFSSDWVITGSPNINNGTITFIGSGTNSSGYVYQDFVLPSGTYTLSYWARTVNAHNVDSSEDGGPRVRFASSVNFVIPPDQDWKYFSHTLTTTGGRLEFSKHDMTTDSIFEIHSPQIEAKNYATPFVNGTRAGTVIDSSGYDNHAELALATTPRWVGTESSKIGSGAYEFDGNSYVTHENIPVGGSFSLSYWIKANSWANRISGGPGSRDNNAFQVRASGNSLYSRLYDANGVMYDMPQWSASDLMGQWQHHALTFDEITKTAKFYVNGIQRTSETFSNYIVGSGTATFITGDQHGHLGYDQLTGCVDDPRIYATALSDEDILELYQTRGSIDSHGNLYVQDIVETGHKPLIADYTVWEDGQTGNTGLAPYFSCFSSSAAASRIIATDPWGNSTVVWKTEPLTNVASGVYISTMPIDNTKTYRVSWWEKRVTNGNATQANYDFGLNGYGSINGVSNLAGTSISTNPYFHLGSMTSDIVTSMLGEWNLMVGFVHPYDYTGSTHPDSGRYNLNGKIASNTNFKWLPETTTCRWRTYTIYRSGEGNSIGAIHYSVYPRVDICDGSEPSIQDLLNGFDSRHIDYVRAKGGANPITLDVGDQSSTFGVIREVGLPVRYIRDWINGSTSNTGNHWVEIEAYCGDVNLALGKSATSPMLTDGAIASNPYYQGGAGLQSVQVDLGEVEIVEVINVRHYYADGRTYHNTKTEVSADGVNWVTVFDSAIEGEYQETSAGHSIPCFVQSFSLGQDGNVFVKEFYEV